MGNRCCRDIGNTFRRHGRSSGGPSVARPGGASPMPWKVSPVSEVRLALCHSVRTLSVSVSEAAPRFGVSRRTAHKWLAVYDAAPAAGQAPLAALRDRPRRPLSSPRRTPPGLEREVL